MEKANSTGRQLSFDAFRSNVKYLASSRGLLGKDLAAEIDTTPATISRYLTNMRDPDLEYVYRLAKYFGVTIDWLLGVSDDQHSQYTDEVNRVAELYSAATPEDKAVIQTVLRKYGK